MQRPASAIHYSTSRLVLIALADEGVFPLCDPDSGVAQTGFPFSGTIQGEGILCGTPSLFIRLAGCNLNCNFPLPDGTFSPCDTPHARQRKTEGKHSAHDIVAHTLANLNGMRHVVITGGEPTLQAEAVTELCKELKNARGDLHITLESNGTNFIPELAELIDLASISPKCTPQTFSGKGIPRKEHLDALQQWVNGCRGKNSGLQLKFVVGTPSDETRIIDPILNALANWEREMIVIMPAGATASTIRTTAQHALSVAIRRGWRYSPRLQVDIWGDTQGV